MPKAEIRQTSAGPTPFCPYCDDISLRRQGRAGFWQQVVSHFGMFPWECGLCRRVYLIRQRQGAPSAAITIDTEYESEREKPSHTAMPHPTSMPERHQTRTAVSARRTA